MAVTEEEGIVPRWESYRFPEPEGTAAVLPGQADLLSQSTPRILHEEVLCEEGSYRRVRRHLSGHYPKLGKLHFGWSGKETVQETNVIIPIGILTVSKK